MADPANSEINISYRGIYGAVQAVDIALRDAYKQTAIFHSSDALERLKFTRTLAPEDAPYAAKALSDFRNLLRAATQQKLSPMGRMLSRWLDANRNWKQIIEKYGDPFDYLRPEADRLASAEKIIEKTGASSPKMNGLQLFGKALLVLNVVACLWQVSDGMSKQGTAKAAEGKVDIAEGTFNAALAVGSYVAVKMKWLTAAGGWAGLGAGILAMGSVSLAAEECRRTARGEKTMIQTAADYYNELYSSGGRQGGIEGRAKQVGAAVGGFFAWPMAWLQSGKWLDYVMD